MPNETSQTSHPIQHLAKLSHCRDIIHDLFEEANTGNGLHYTKEQTELLTAGCAKVNYWLNRLCGYYLKHTTIAIESDIAIPPTDVDPNLVPTPERSDIIPQEPITPTPTALQPTPSPVHPEPKPSTDLNCCDS